VRIQRLTALTVALLVKNIKVTKEEVKLMLKCLLMHFRNFYIEVKFRIKQTSVNEVHGREADILRSMKQVQIKLRKI
jgi:predicted transposase YdaD